MPKKNDFKFDVVSARISSERFSSKAVPQMMFASGCALWVMRPAAVSTSSRPMSGLEVMLMMTPCAPAMQYGTGGNPGTDAGNAFLPHIVNLMSSRQRTLGHAAGFQCNVCSNRFPHNFCAVFRLYFYPRHQNSRFRSGFFFQNYPVNLNAGPLFIQWSWPSSGVLSLSSRQL